MTRPRRIAFLAFPQLTVLDLVGAYDALRRVGPMGIDPPVRCHVVGTEPEIDDGSGLRFHPESVYPDPAGFDLLVVPGGMGTRALAEDARCIEWLRAWGSDRPLASVCTGSLLLGRAGHLRGLRATTHHAALEELRPWCGEVLADRRVVDEGRVVTAAGVSSSLDLGLHLVERYWGAAARARIARQMEYRDHGTA